jgi:cytochrome c
MEAHGSPMHNVTAPRWVLIIAAIVVFAAGVISWYVAAANRQDVQRRAAIVTGGDPKHGRLLVRSTGCSGCHEIPAVDGATGTVGPSLASISRRVYIGTMLNTPEHLIQWLRNPRSIDPMAAMPNVGLSEQQARDVAAFLYTLE